MKAYDKLVRDKIPEIIQANGGECRTSILNDEDYEKALERKLEEELKEYLDSGSLEELADMEEVIGAILDFKGISYEDFERIREEKLYERGGFKERIFLEYVENKNEN